MRRSANIVILLCIVLAGCSNAYILSSSGRSMPQTFKRILVIALIPEETPTLQEKMEKHLASELNALGYIVTLSSEHYRADTFYDLPEKQVLSQVGTDSIDAILTIMLLNKENNKDLLPMSTWTGPPDHGETDSWTYFLLGPKKYYAPGDYVETTRYSWQSNFYENATHSLIYSAKAISFNPNSVEQLARDYSRIIIRDMLRNKIIGRKNKEAEKNSFNTAGF